MNLLAKFPRRCHHKHLNSAFGNIEAFHRRQHEGCRFASACASLTDTVASGKSDGNECHLNGAGLFVADFRDRFEGCGREAELSKS